jgi:hypothetical protein
MAESVPIEKFGPDHWACLAIIESAAVNKQPVVAMHLRQKPAGMDPARRILWNAKYGTRLADGSRVPNHDDGDCIVDLLAAGVLEVRAPETDPYKATLTDLGWTLAGRLRRYHAEGGNNHYRGFAPLPT